MEPTTLILCGASVRAAAASARRAGFAVWCADLFGDADLLALCPNARRIADYPQGLPALLEKAAPPGPCVFTGSLENHPAVLAAIRQHRPVWGMSSDVLHKVRQPERLQAALAAGGFPTLQICLGPPPLDSAVTWLCKPLASGGGRHIHLWHASQTPCNTLDCYWQEYKPGEAYSALYLADGQATMLLGLCQQLVGQPWLHAARFAYCGNIGPLPMNACERGPLQALGEHLSACFGLHGLFGVDLIRKGDRFFVTEVNPRYTASVELYELAYQVPLFAWHAARWQVPACANSNALTSRESSCSTGTPCLGKAILYAPAELLIPTDFFACPDSVDLWRLPVLADVPVPGTVIPPGQPVLTLYAEGNDAVACRLGLEKAAYALDVRFRRL